MIHAGRAVLTRELERLFGEGTVTVGGGELLDRYLSRRDEAAFEALVRQHGPMVLASAGAIFATRTTSRTPSRRRSWCWSARRPTLRQRELLGSWLYGVAYRVAMRARSDRRSGGAGRRTGRGRWISPARLADESAEVGRVLDEELDRLPEKYRVADGALLPGRPDPRAGRRRARLAGRDGPEPPGPGPRAAPRPADPPRLCPLGGDPRDGPRAVQSARSTPRSPRHRACDRGRGGAIPPGRVGGCRGRNRHVALFPCVSGSATTLAEGVLSTMALTQLKLIVAGLVAAGMLAGGAGAGAWGLASSGPGPQADRPAAKAADKPPAKPSTSPTTPVALPPGDAARFPSPEPATDREAELESRLMSVEKNLDSLLTRRAMESSQSSRPGADRPSELESRLANLERNLICCSGRGKCRRLLSRFHAARAPGRHLGESIRTRSRDAAARPATCDRRRPDPEARTAAGT